MVLAHTSRYASRICRKEFMGSNWAPLLVASLAIAKSFHPRPANKRQPEFSANPSCCCDGRRSPAVTGASAPSAASQYTTAGPRQPDVGLLGRRVLGGCRLGLQWLRG